MLRQISAYVLVLLSIHVAKSRAREESRREKNKMCFIIKAESASLSLDSHLSAAAANKFVTLNFQFFFRFWRTVGFENVLTPTVSTSLFKSGIGPRKGIVQRRVLV